MIIKLKQAQHIENIMLSRLFKVGLKHGLNGGDEGPCFDREI
jgi:hypothetical protein